MIDISNEGTCEGVAKLSKKLSGKVSAKDFVGSPEASATLSTAENITTKITNFKWITLEQTIFEEKVDVLEDGSRLLTSILDNNTFVITRALRVEGLNVTYSFSSAIGADAQAKFNQLDAGLSGNWTNNTTFELTVNKPFYIAGELRPYLESGLSSSGTKFGENIEISKNATVATDKEEI
ncbi:hypothetical protein [Marinoscillum pacificum]|uniref:hypothetical protein n=1 Tax=Marinoscillum pacificum TaxID=392723 RepID=UPI002158134C|nr:hypothetical protein [Marinoscillum pacificum]